MHETAGIPAGSWQETSMASSNVPAEKRWDAEIAQPCNPESLNAGCHEVYSQRITRDVLFFFFSGTNAAPEHEGQCPHLVRGRWLPLPQGGARWHSRNTRGGSPVMQTGRSNDQGPEGIKEGVPAHGGLAPVGLRRRGLSGGGGKWSPPPLHARTGRKAWLHGGDSSNSRVRI